jgi:hypothetical protein
MYIHPGGRSGSLYNIPVMGFPASIVTLNAFYYQTEKENPSGVDL